MRARIATLMLAASVTLGGCAYNGLGVGVGYGDPYGYGYGSSYGPYGSYGYYDPYGAPFGYGYYPYGNYGSYGSPFGWYDGFYYPGSGYYVYDRDRRRHTMTEAQRQYWKDKFSRIRSGSTSTAVKTTSVAPRENWSGFSRRSNTVSTVDRQSIRAARQQAFEQRSSERSQARSERLQTRIQSIRSNEGRGHRSDPQNNEQ